MEEILSVGEKIRRTRIYKNYTLKDLCNDKLSVSKLSCIENDKIKPDQQTLEYIAQRLDVDIDSLKYGIVEQLETNIKKINSNIINDDIENVIKGNLRIAEEYCYYDIAYTLIRMLFNYYIDKRKNKKIQDIISQYLDLCIKSNNVNNVSFYFIDMGRYLFINNEFEEAAENLNNARTFFDRRGQHDENYIKALTDETKCHFMDKQFEKVQEMCELLEEYKDKTEDKIVNGCVYSMLSVIYYLKQEAKYKDYFDKALSLFENDNTNKALSYFYFAYLYLKIEDKDTGMKLIKKAKSLYPKENLQQYVSFSIMLLKLLIENNMVEAANSICDETLDSAIRFDDTVYIEKAYYYKSILLFKSNNISSAEMYMNLSLGLFEKIASKHEIYLRYMEIGDMYHKLELNDEALKYFSIGISFSNKL